MNKKTLRDEFRLKSFERDKFVCVMCGHKPNNLDELDVHHIVDRHKMPFGGYIPANGISLCTDRCELSEIDCHQKAESLHSTGVAIPGYAPNDLYAKIKSSYEWAYSESLRLELSLIEANSIIRSIQHISKKEKEICSELNESISSESWDLTCDELNESNSLIRAYGKGRYVPDDRAKRYFKSNDQ